MERRTLDEIAARYDFEPGLRDVYVEGPTDARFVEWLLEEAGIGEVVAYEIGSVDIPPAMLAARGLEPNNRSRVILLCMELEEKTQRDLIHSVAGIVDGDLDHFEQIVPTERLLIVTDFTAVEMYLFSRRVLAKLFKLVLVRANIDPDAVLDALTPLLKELFFVRVAAKRLEVPLSLIDPWGLCSHSDGKVVFDRQEYVARFIRRQGFAMQHDRFLREVETLHQATVQERRFVIHGQDLVAGLRWYCREVLRIPSVPNVDTFHKVLWGCLELRDCSESELLRQLRARFQ